MTPNETAAPPAHVAGRIFRGLVGVAAGTLTLVVAHRGSQALSKYALSHGWLELHSGWWSTRFAAWAAISILVGALLGAAFGHRAIAPAILAAVTPPIIYICSFLYLFEGDASFSSGPIGLKRALCCLCYLQ